MLWLVVVVTSLAVGARVRAVSEGAVCDARQDLDGDGAVTSFDLSLLLSAWGPCAAAGPCRGDANGDSEVGVHDLHTLLACLSGGVAPWCVADQVEAARRDAQRWLRVRAALEAACEVPVPCPESNGDEERYNATRAGSFSKGLPHDALGHVREDAYAELLQAVATGDAAAFDAIPMAGSRRLVNPQAGLAFDMQGRDSHTFSLPPAPAMASAQAAGEMVELYWMAVMRDVPFDAYATHPLAAQASAALAALAQYAGPTAPGLLFRHYAAGAQVGPYVSQFLYMELPFGANQIDQRVEPPVAGKDFMTSWDEWLRIQNGEQPSETTTLQQSRRYLMTGRDLAHWVHIDVLFQAYFHTMLGLLHVGAPLKDSNPYAASLTQTGFGTFGPPFIATLVAEPATRALKTVWHQKWFVHRRLRPEAFGARVDRHKRGVYTYPLHADVVNSTVVDRIWAAHGSYLLPQAFPEGSPLHPSYGAGHATVAGAVTTFLKALFNESWVLPSPVVPNTDGSALLPYSGPPLTVGGELNKVAANVAIGRNWGGVHWHSDAVESLRLGEQVAIALLRDMLPTFNEPFAGWSFTSFDGQVVEIRQ